MIFLIFDYTFDLINLENLDFLKFLVGFSKVNSITVGFPFELQRHNYLMDMSQS